METSVGRTLASSSHPRLLAMLMSGRRKVGANAREVGDAGDYEKPDVEAAYLRAELMMATT